MIISGREKVMLAATLLTGLYGILGLTARKQIESFRQLNATRHELQQVESDRQNLVAQHHDWSGQYAALQNLMPLFSADRQVATHWLAIMDRLASANGLSILRRQAGEERRVGDVYEMPIECKDWEGSLESLIRFLYDLQAEGAMLDVRHIFIRPVPNKPGLLRGSFTLYCAYLRQTATAGEREP